MFGREAARSLARSALGIWALRVAMLYWRNQQRLVSVDAATSLEAIFYSWLWLRLLRLLADSESAAEQRSGPEREARSGH